MMAFDMLLLRSTTVLLLFLSCIGCKQKTVTPTATLPPFHPGVLFQSLDRGNGNRSDMVFGIKPLNPAGPTQFLKIGDMVAKTRIRLTDFDPATEEVIVTDTVTKQTARLRRPKVVNSPPSF